MRAFLFYNWGFNKGFISLSLVSISRIMRNSFVTQLCRVYGMDNAKFGYLISIFNTTKKELPPHNSEIRQVRNNFGYAVRGWGTRLKEPTPYR
jgi:hypothetical protein